MTEDKFVKHLNSLYDVYKPDDEGIPTGDQLLGGLMLPPGNLSFDQQLEICNRIVDTFIECVDQYKGKSYNILLRDKFSNLLLVLETLSVELQYLVISNISERSKHYKVFHENWYSSVPKHITDMLEKVQTI